MAHFSHPNYFLVNDEIVMIKATTTSPSIRPSVSTMSYAEQGEVMHEIGRYVESKIINDYGFVALKIPEDDVPASTSILVSADFYTASRLLVIAHNAVGSMLGIFSRSMCLDRGLSHGSMLPYIKRAREQGYAVLIMRPNTNSVMTEMKTALGSAHVKVPIQGSETPEAHAMYVWENIMPKAEGVRHVVLLGYGNGASLCKEMFLRQIVRSKQDETDVNYIKGFVTIEASHILEDDDAVDVKDALESMAVNMESSRSKEAKLGCSLTYREAKLGCCTLCLGGAEGVSAAAAVSATSVSSHSTGASNPQTATALSPKGAGAHTGAAVNVAASVVLALDPVFEYISMTETMESNIIARRFMTKMANRFGLRGSTTELTVNPLSAAEEEALRVQALHGATAAGPSNTVDEESAEKRDPIWTFPIWNKFFGKDGDQSGSGKHRERGADGQFKLAVSDFDLLKVVGKGAFGKVLLVRKKSGDGAGHVYAMKVLKKSMVMDKGQLEHTMSEREILCEIRHPYIVRLRYAFQSAEKLYLVTDYYVGGSLFYHLRKSRAFPEARAKFYAAELLLALEHLHSQHIIYRDLKLENVLMDSAGHIALTDFGLSKQKINETGGATTFCGTAEYIAPELLKGTKYGAAVDWWSFGVLLYEMMFGKTPFYDKNRKLMFYRIINTPVTFPSAFSKDACAVLKGLLTVNEDSRLNVHSCKASKYFSSIDFTALLQRAVTPPFAPAVGTELDTKYVPKTYLQAEAKDSFAEPIKKNQKECFNAFTFEGEKSTLHNDDE